MYNGEIKGFPKEVVDKILYYQVQQGNEKDLLVFEKNSRVFKYTGGFSWDETEEGAYFWVDVIGNKNFDKFFVLFPKQSTPYIVKCDDSHQSQKVIDYIYEKFNKKTSKFSYWYIIVIDSKGISNVHMTMPEHLKHLPVFSFSKFLNKTNQNHESINEKGTITEIGVNHRGREISIPIGRRQITVGSRPTGNQQSFNCKKARIVTAQICPKVISY